MIKLYNGDCSDILKSIPEGSVDLILQALRTIQLLANGNGT